MLPVQVTHYAVVDARTGQVTRTPHGKRRIARDRQSAHRWAELLNSEHDTTPAGDVP